MEPEEYRYLFELEESLWWFQGMKNITRSLIERFGPDERNLRILDAGCGTGGMLGFLGQYGSVVGIDVFAEAIDFARRRDGARLARASVTRLPFPDKSFDVVTEFEVINHWSVDDDQAAFNEIARVLRGGGLLFFREPAYQWLFAKHDLAVHTRERYAQKMLGQKLREAGLTPVYQGYADCLLFPVALARRLAGNLLPGGQRSDVRRIPRPLNQLLASALSFEARILRKGKLPFGLSHVGVARKD